MMGAPGSHQEADREEQVGGGVEGSGGPPIPRSFPCFLWPIAALAHQCQVLVAPLEHGASFAPPSLHLPEAWSLGDGA